jgi:hypothetical protein
VNHHPDHQLGPHAQPTHSTARDHVRQLRDQGGTFRAIAEAAGLGTMTVHDLAADGRPAAPVTVAAVLRVRPIAMPRIRLDAGGTRLRLRALHVMGHGSARLAQAVGVSEWTIRHLVNGTATTVSTRLRDRVITVYDQWWDKRAPERTPAERAAATLARRRAIRGNWCAAAALDDDILDTPGYKPRYGWRPATGTGTATDITPPKTPTPPAPPMTTTTPPAIPEHRKPTAPSWTRTQVAEQIQRTGPSLQDALQQARLAGPDHEPMVDFEAEP